MIQANDSKPVLIFYIGNTKLVSLRGRFEKNGRIWVELWRECEPAGFDSTRVINFPEAVSSVGRLLAEIATREELDRLPIQVVIAQNSVKSYQFEGSIYFPFIKPITDRDIENLRDETRSTVTIPLSEVILTHHELEYLINDEPGVINPLELEAERLGVRTLFFRLPLSQYRDLTKVFEMNAVEIGTWGIRGLVSAYACLSEDQMKNGILLIDMGATVIDFFYFRNSLMKSMQRLPVGIGLIEKHLSEEFQISRDEARRIKEELGFDSEIPSFEEEIILLKDEEGGRKGTETAKKLREEIREEGEPLIEQVASQIENIVYQFRSVEKVLITGGGARMHGFLERLQKRLSLPCELGVTKGIDGAVELLGSPDYTAVTGFLKRYSVSKIEEWKRFESMDFLAQWVEVTRKWIREYF